MSKKRELVAVTVGEGALVLVIAAMGWATRMPLIFTSLGPTAYEQLEKPNSPSAKLYNVIAGHMLAMGAGFFSLWALGAWSAPKVASAGFVPAARIWAAVLAVVITTLTTLALKASQPASLSTALLVSLGSMQRGRDALAIFFGVLIIAGIGEPVRRIRAKAKSEEQSSPPQPRTILPTS